MPRKSVDDRLDELEAAVADADASELIGVIDSALADKSYRVVALAAKTAEDSLLYDCVPALQQSFARLLIDPVKRDPSCFGKKAIVRALCALDCDDPDFWLSAIGYRQMEPVWGGTEDTAVNVRCSAAMGLVASGYPRALIDVAELLTDPEAPVRGGAARAIACGNPKEAELLLRLKLSMGDDDAMVMGDCFTGLLEAEPDESVDFVARFLTHEADEIREAAALALGESRIESALDALKVAWDDVLVPDWFRRVLIRAAALHRSDAAFDWLIEIVATGPEAMVREIVDALSIYRENDNLVARVNATLKRRDEPELAALSV